MARYDDLNTSAIAYATFVSSVLLLVIILLVRALCYSWVEAEDARKLSGAHYSSADQMISEQKATLSGYKKETIEVPAEDAAADAQTQPVSTERLLIPIDRAKELILQEYANDSDQDA